MPVTVTHTLTRPDGVRGFAAQSPANKAIVESIRAWTATQPGFVSQTFAKPLYTVVWSTPTDYANWKAALSAKPEHIEIVKYNIANNIKSTWTETLS